jgi:hypothetical protein
MTSTRKKVFKSALSVDNLSCSLVEWGVCHSCQLLALRVTVKFDCYIETLRSLNACLCWVDCTWNCQKCCFLGPQPSVHTTETIIRYGWAVLLHPSCTADPTPSVSPVWSFKGWPGMTALCRLGGTAEACVPGAAGEGVQHIMGWTVVPCSKEEEGWWQRCRLYWISYAFDSDVVQLHEIVTCHL